MAAEGTADRPLALVEVAHLSDTGRIRHHNEDRSLASRRVLVVADGMGGAKAGEVAAQMAVDAVGAPRGPGRGGDVRSGGGAGQPGDPAPGTRRPGQVRHGHDPHRRDARGRPPRRGARRRLARLPLARRPPAPGDRGPLGGGRAGARGSITREEAETHPHRNVITRALGAEPQVVDADVLARTCRTATSCCSAATASRRTSPEAAIAEVLADAARSTPRRRAWWSGPTAPAAPTT